MACGPCSSDTNRFLSWSDHFYAVYVNGVAIVPPGSHPSPESEFGSCSVPLHSNANLAHKGRLEGSL